MLKRLRIKFIALTMAIVATVLVVVFTAICVIDYRQSVDGVQAALDAAVMHAPGDERPAPTGAQMPSGEETAPAPLEGSGISDRTDAAPLPPQIGGMRDRGEQVIPVAVYAVGSDGALEAVPTRTTASISDDVLAQAADALAGAPDGQGRLDALGLFYTKRTAGDGTSYLAFADASAASSWQSLALILAGVGLAALAVFFVVSVFFSRWALRPVEEAWNQQRRFVADASHELKTPLTVILANSSILLEHPERPIARESQWIESTQTEAERMQELVGDLLELARPDADAPARAQEPLDFTNLVEGNLLQFESVAFERSIELASELEPNIVIRGDARRLHRLLSTLLDNACKYADAGGTVTVTLHRRAHNAQLTVHNTGAAIAPEDLPHVFDRFYRADKARTRDVGGYGLGLAIARDVAEEHGGTLAAASSPERGTTFTATLPLASC